MSKSFSHFAMPKVLNLLNRAFTERKMSGYLTVLKRFEITLYFQRKEITVSLS